MLVCVLTPVRLLGEAIAATLHGQNTAQVEVLWELDQARARVTSNPQPALLIIDTMQPLQLEDIRAFHMEFPALPLMALGLRESADDIVAHGRAGFSCYLRREEGIEALCNRIGDALAGRMPCSSEMAAAMMRGLFQDEPPGDVAVLASLTRRENHIAHFVSRGLSNKEIARELTLSESTVKAHVHSILGKCRLSTRMQLMRRMRQDVWRQEPGAAARGLR